MCKAISAIDSVYNRTHDDATLECEFKSLSDELEEDEDLDNKLKCDQMTSDEQILSRQRQDFNTGNKHFRVKMQGRYNSQKRLARWRRTSQQTSPSFPMRPRTLRV